MDNLNAIVNAVIITSILGLFGLVGVCLWALAKLESRVDRLEKEED